MVATPAAERGTLPPGELESLLHPYPACLAGCLACPGNLPMDVEDGWSLCKNDKHTHKQPIDIYYYLGITPYPPSYYSNKSPTITTTHKNN